MLSTVGKVQHVDRRCAMLHHIDPNRQPIKGRAVHPGQVFRLQFATGEVVRAQACLSTGVLSPGST